MVAVFAAALAVAVSAPADWPPAPGSGGANCTVDAECGLPAANCEELRDDCVSMSGRCDNGRCVCATNYYGCANCHAKAVLDRSPTDMSTFQYTTEHMMLDGSGRKFNECAVVSGGRRCAGDSDCGGRGGLCIASRCVCPDAWQCDDCSLTLTDLLYGLQCGVARNGGGSCESDADCNKGRCEKTGDGRPFCACTALWGCEHCEHSVHDLATGRTTCPEGKDVVAEE